MSEHSTYCLCAEELAFALNLAGKPEVAQGLLASHFGKLDEKETRMRLIVAGHSLMSKGLLSVNTTKGESHLDATLANSVPLLAQADFSIRFSRVQDNVEQNLTYHLHGKEILRHQVKEGVLHDLSMVSDVMSVVEGGGAFLGVRESEPFDCSEFDILGRTLEETKRRASVEPQAAAASLRDAGIPGPIASMLIEDFGHTVFRGSGLRIEYLAEGRPSSDYGFMVLRGARRLWLFRLFANREQPGVRIRPGTEKNLEHEVRLLLARSTE